MGDLLDSKKLVIQLMATDDSISRAGRNCSTGLTRKPREPQSARGPGGGGAATMKGSATIGAGSSSPTLGAASAAPSGSLTSRGSRDTRAQERAAVKALNITSAVNDHKLAFGRGVADDDGGRGELCSSPRPHPEYDAFMLEEFQAGRRQAFADIQDAAGHLELVDAAAVEEEVAARAPLGIVAGIGGGVGSPRHTQPPLPTLATPRQDTGGAISGRTSPAMGGGKATPRALSPGVTSQGGAQPLHSGGTSQTPAAARHVPAPPPAAKLASGGGQHHAHPAEGAAGATSPRVGGAAPRPKKDTVSASFSAPERFIPPSKSSAVMVFPDSWRYRPKYALVHNRAPGGVMLPPGSSTSRLPPPDNSKEPKAPMNEVIRSARDSVRPPALKEREERRRAQAAADDDEGDDGGGLSSRRKGAGAPQPSHISSPAFKSKVACVTSASRPSAAPDTVYWPQSENGTHMRDGAHLSFAKQTPRPPLAGNVVLPDPRAVVTAFTADVARNAPSFEKYSPRKGFEPRHAAPDAPLATDRADKMRYNRAPVADFSAPAPSPRAVGKPADRAIPTTVTVESVPEIKRPFERQPHSPSFASMTPRKDAKPAADLPPLQVDYTAVQHRSRGAAVRADGAGHDGFMAGSRHAIITEVGAYDPNIAAVRPRGIRDVDLAKGTARKEPRANIADLDYDTKPAASPRVRGNPMMGQQVSRTKREQVLASKSGAADVTYDVRVPKMSGGSGMTEMSRQVDRPHHAGGRGVPVEITVERQRKEQFAAEDAAAARAAEKSAAKAAASGGASSPRRRSPRR